MGPVADMSTFPPTMANTQPDDLGLLSMNSILSGGFCDNVLVPGEFVDVVQSEIDINIIYRLFQPYGRAEWGLCLRRGRQRLHCAPVQRYAYDVGDE